MCCASDEEYGVRNFIHSVVYKTGRKYIEMQELWATLPFFSLLMLWLFYFPSFFILRMFGGEGSGAQSWGVWLLVGLAGLCEAQLCPELRAAFAITTDVAAPAGEGEAGGGHCGAP